MRPSDFYHLPKEINLTKEYRDARLVEIYDAWYRWAGCNPDGTYIFAETFVELRIKKDFVIIVGIKPPEVGEMVSHKGKTYKVLKERIGSWKFIYDVERMESQLELFLR